MPSPSILLGFISCWLVAQSLQCVSRAAAYERCSDRSYSGKFAMFGEDILGYLRTDLKAAPRWQHGVWMGKTMSGDLHIIATATGVFVTRSIRRNAVPFKLSRLGDIENWPWEFGYAALGNRLVYNKRVTQPLALGVGAAVPPQIDVEAIQVEQYALAHPNEVLENEAEAGEVAKQPEMIESSAVPEASTAEASSRWFSLLEESFLVDDSEAGRQAPKTPKLDDEEYKRRLIQVTSTDLSLYELEDQPVSFSFEDDDMERLEDYEFRLAVMSSMMAVFARMMRG
eukprot:s36_g28.t1